MRPIATDVTRSVCVGKTGEMCKNGSTDPYAIWGWLVGSRKHYKIGSISDESIRQGEGRQDGDVVFCQNSLTAC